MKRSLTVFVFLLVLSGMAGLFAQERGSITGFIKTFEGAPVADAVVKITSDLLPAGRTFTTGRDGQFRFPSIPPGTYILTATHPELTPVNEKEDVIVGLGRSAQVTVVMVAVGKIAEEVTVTARSPVIDLKSTEISSNWQKQLVEKLPLGRSYSSLWQLASGVADNRDFAPNAGGNKQDNVFLYDGSNITNPFFGTLGANFSELDIAEVNIKRGAISAEFGRAAGMVTNAITKSGTNMFSGSFRLVAEPSGFTWKSKDSTIVTKYNRYNPAFSLGGPIIKDKIWFYTSANIPRSTTTGRINNLGPVPDANSIENEFFFKLSANPHPNHLITASIRNNDFKDEKAGVGVNDHPDVSITGNGLSRIIYLSWAWTISQSTYLEVKYDHVNEDYKSVPNKALGYQPTFDPAHPERMGYFQTAAEFSQVGGAKLSGQYVGAASEYNTQNFFRDEFKLVLHQYLDFSGHSHLIKAGFGFDDGGEYLEREANGWGSILYYPTGSSTYDSLKRPGFRARYYPKQAPQDSRGRTYSIFLQDTVSIGERLTLTLGVLANRDEFSAKTSAGKNTFLKFGFDKEIQPRLGFTYMVDKKAGDKLFANWGRYNNMDNRSLARAAAPLRVYRQDAYFLLADGSKVYDVPQVSETGKVILPGLKPTYSDEFVLGYSRPFLKYWSVEVWGQHRNVKNVIEDYPTVNRLTSPSSFVYGNLSGDLKDINGNIVATGVTAKREYKAFSIEVKKQLADHWSLTAMYTWSKLYGNWDLDYAPGTSLFYASSYIEDAPGLYIEDPLRTGYMQGDRTHIFKLFGTWEFYKNLTLGGYLRVQSGRPWEARLKDYYGNYYMYAEKAGSHRLDTWPNLDLQLSYTIPLGGRFQGIVEARMMNIFDTQTVMSIDVRSDQPTFKNPTSYVSPRKFALTFYINF
ncbi:MAG: TonB-dependent receptor [Candidatus Aminicenantes bacterium]|nr:TonB-dependent receptor [Candidatus Aminicenantes bacterium]